MPEGKEMLLKKQTHGVTWAIVLLSSVGYFSFQPVLHDWCNNGRGMCYPVSGMVHIKEPLLLLEKSSPCGGSGFPLSLSEWSFTICLMPYNHKYNVLSASLNKTFPSFLCGIVRKVTANWKYSIKWWQRVSSHYLSGLTPNIECVECMFKLKIPSFKTFFKDTKWLSGVKT